MSERGPEMTDEQQEILAPYAERLHELTGSLIAEIEAAGTEHLEKLVPALWLASTTNCGWSSYFIAQIMRGRAFQELEKRKRGDAARPLVVVLE